ncbi:hypothetical protein KVR01_000307 [Diaporthe batatas]|uniref:uncharacterized protein n=1 Tax=Diaporthe batatas TaxID=748121 RepID=UPI001D04B146|nr:uncharacterized protein KVR01_000307 [Diaporthe batatas]KAG8169562.1 hypothetical protein KVR01_000307 [Diaporthe batatas]
MYLPLTATALCETRSHQGTHLSGDSGVRRILAPFLELLPAATSAARPLPAACGDLDMTPIGHDHDHGGGGGGSSSSHVLPDEIQEGTLLFLLSNPLLLSLTVDHLPPSATVSLAATSRAFRSLIYHTPGVFRRLDLTQVKSAQFDVDPIDQGGIFGALRRHQILRDVSTLILDGLSVTAELVHEIISDPSYSVRILSLREVTNLNEPKLRAALQMAARPSRPEGMPRLRGLYIFGPKDPPCLTVDTAAIGNGGNATAAGWNQRSHQALSDALHQPSDPCMECLRDRYCWGCSKWWCEKCYVPGQMDSHVDGLYYKVRDGLCEECVGVDDELFGGRLSDTPRSET